MSILSEAEQALQAAAKQANAYLATKGTSLPLLAQGADGALKAFEANPSESLVQIAEEGAEIAFPQYAWLIELAPLLLSVAQAGGFNPADWNSPVNIARSDDIYEAPAP